MKFFVSIVVLRFMSDTIASDLSAQGTSCQVQHVGIYNLFVHWLWVFTDCLPSTDPSGPGLALIIVRSISLIHL